MRFELVAVLLPPRRPRPGGGWWNGSWPWWMVAPCSLSEVALFEKVRGDTERQALDGLIDEQLMYREAAPAAPRPR